MTDHLKNHYREDNYNYNNSYSDPDIDSPYNDNNENDIDNDMDDDYDDSLHLQVNNHTKSMIERNQIMNNNNNNNHRSLEIPYDISDNRPLLERVPVDLDRSRFPFAVVWGPLPLITWLFPFIGHMGICDSQGRVHDFAGPYTIGLDNFMVSVTRYYQFDPEIIGIDTNNFSNNESGVGSNNNTNNNDTDIIGGEGAKAEALRRTWDRAIIQADGEFRKQMHNICCNNCHHHSARAMRLMGGSTCSRMTMLRLAAIVLFKGRFTNFGGFLSTWLPFLIIVTGAFLLGFFTSR